MPVVLLIVAVMLLVNSIIYLDPPESYVAQAAAVALCIMVVSVCILRLRAMSRKAKSQDAS